MSLSVLHFGDIHLPFPPGSFRSPEIFHPKRIPALFNFYTRRGSKYADAVQKLDGLRDYLRREPVDWLLYTGDTLNQGLEREYVAATPRLSETLALARNGALAIPGNHDLYTAASLRLYRRIMTPRLPKSDLPDAQTPSGFPLVRFMGETAAAIALNSSVPHLPFWDSSGRLDSAELNALARLLDRPDIAKLPTVFLMTHYPFLDTDWFHGLRNTRPFWKILEGRTNLVLLHGHNHRPYTLRTPAGLPVYCSGSLSKNGAESFWRFDLFGGTLNARRGIWKNARFTLVPEDPT